MQKFVLSAGLQFAFVLLKCKMPLWTSCKHTSNSSSLNNTDVWLTGVACCVTGACWVCAFRSDKEKEVPGGCVNINQAKATKFPQSGFRERCLHWPTLCQGGEVRCEGHRWHKRPCRHIPTRAVTSFSPSFPSLHTDPPVPCPKLQGSPGRSPSALQRPAHGCSIQLLSSARFLLHHLLLNLFC